LLKLEQACAINNFKKYSVNKNPRSGSVTAEKGGMMVMVITKVALTLGFALIVITPLASVSGLQCCQCNYLEGGGEQCNCKSNPAKRDCSDEKQSQRSSVGEDTFLAAGFNEKAKKSRVQACYYGTLRKNGTLQVKRTIGHFAGNVSSSCKMEKYPDNKNQSVTDIEVCLCNTDWCNCSGCDQLFSSLILIFASILLIARM
jgi:hypothetical protein